MHFIPCLLRISWHDTTTTTLCLIVVPLLVIEQDATVHPIDTDPVDLFLLVQVDIDTTTTTILKTNPIENMDVDTVIVVKGRKTLFNESCSHTWCKKETSTFSVI